MTELTCISNDEVFSVVVFLLLPKVKVFKSIEWSVLFAGFSSSYISFVDNKILFLMHQFCVEILFRFYHAFACIHFGILNSPSLFNQLILGDILILLCLYVSVSPEEHTSTKIALIVSTATKEIRSVEKE